MAKITRVVTEVLGNSRCDQVHVSRDGRVLCIRRVVCQSHVWEGGRDVCSGERQVQAYPSLTWEAEKAVADEALRHNSYLMLRGGSGRLLTQWRPAEPTVAIASMLFHNLLTHFPSSQWPQFLEKRFFFFLFCSECSVMMCDSDAYFYNSNDGMT